jgi:hypothetical protein
LLRDDPPYGRLSLAWLADGLGASGWAGAREDDLHVGRIERLVLTGPLAGHKDIVNTGDQRRDAGLDGEGSGALAVDWPMTR